MAEDKGKGKEKEHDDDEARSQERNAESVIAKLEDWAKELERALNAAKYKGQGSSSAFSNAKLETITQDQVDLAYHLCRERVPLDSIMQIMGVEEGAVDPLELKQVILEIEVSIARDLNAQEDETHIQAPSQSGGEEFEAYDPVNWETATEEHRIILQSLEAPPGTPTSEGHALKHLEEDDEQKPQGDLVPAPEFVRALRDSKVGSKPYFRTGDVLRVINRAFRGSLDDRFFELLPLKPPGEAGAALIQDFEPADQEAVDEVGREARTEKELHSFWYAISWED